MLIVVVILGSKLASGIRLAKYVRSYGERANDVDTASKCTSAVFLHFFSPFFLFVSLLRLLGGLLCRCFWITWDLRLGIAAN